MANSILGTIDLFQRQQQRNFQNALAQANYELAVQREARLAKQEETRDQYAANQEARAVKQDTRLDSQEARAADRHTGAGAPRRRCGDRRGGVHPLPEASLHLEPS